YLLKLAPDGEEVWAILFDDAHKTHGNAVTVDASGDVIVTGNTASYYDVRSPAGTEMFVRKLTSDGVQLWEDWFGHSGWDISSGVATDADGNIFNTGYTLGELGDASFGERDVYLRKYLP